MGDFICRRLSYRKGLAIGVDLNTVLENESIGMIAVVTTEFPAPAPEIKVCSDFRFAQLSFENFTRLALQNADFYAAILESTQFRETNLIQARFDESLIKNASFHRAHLEGASFCSSELSYADFSNANLEKATFSKANCVGVNFRGANLMGASFEATRLGDDIAENNFNDAVYDGSTVFPSGFNPQEHRMLYRECV